MLEAMRFDCLSLFAGFWGLMKVLTIGAWSRSEPVKLVVGVLGAIVPSVMRVNFKGTQLLIS
jgi:hypothetical protein